MIRNTVNSNLEGSPGYNIRVADWFEFRKAAYAFSFDDGLRSQYEFAAPLLKKFGFRGTFYLITSKMDSTDINDDSNCHGTWDQFLSLSAQGHELGIHTHTHPLLPSLEDGPHDREGTLQYELFHPLKVLAEKKPGYRAISFAYPFGNFNEHISKEALTQYVSLRSAGTWHNSGSPAMTDLQVNDLTPPTKTGTIEAWVYNHIIVPGGWGIFLGHDVMPASALEQAKKAREAVTTENFEKFLLWIREKEQIGHLWVDTVGNISRYIQERDAAQIELLEANESHLAFRLTDHLPDDVYHFPLTLEVTLPEDWNSVNILHKDLVTVRNIAEGKLIFNAVPDAERIEIRKVTI